MSANRMLFKFAFRYPGWMLLTIVFGFSGAIFNGVSTTLIIPILLQYLGQPVKLGGLPPIIQTLLAAIGTGTGPNSALLMISVILGMLILKNASNYFSALVSSQLTRMLTNDIRKEGLKLILDVDWTYYVRTKIGDIINYLGAEVGRTASAIRNAIQLLTTVITILVFVSILIAISWKLTVITTFLLGLVTLANQYYINRAKVFGAMLTDQSRLYSGSMLELLSGMRLVKATASEQREYQKLDQLIALRERSDFQSQANNAVINPVNEIAGMLTILSIVVFGRMFFNSQLDSLSTVLLTYLLILFRLLPYIGLLNSLRSTFANTAPSVALIADFLDRSNKPFMANGGKTFTGLSQEIRFENIVFQYPGNESPVLKGLSLNLPRGTTLALVGSSGAGKSTLADLLPRFYDPIEGRITLDGVDIRDYDIASFRRHLGIVSQDTFLFNTSVRENIAYGCENVTDDRVIEAAKRANAYEFIVNLPQGFETPIGDRGVLLSGGQRQRLAIARALLRDPQILILDEATSALDTVSERLVQQAIDELSQSRTTLVIAHRLSTIRRAHQIAVLDKGLVVEVGTHEALLEKQGHYYRLYQMQFAGTQDSAETSVDDQIGDQHIGDQHIGDQIGDAAIVASR
jgi:ATP-binding cassette, subfamily B, bacterial MsbA